MRFLLLILILPSSYGLAYMTGEGSIDLGVSHEEEQQNFGLASTYQFSHSNSWMSTYLYNKTQLGSDKGRSLVATAAHEYQYEQSFVNSELGNEFNFYYPGLSWESHLSQNIEFDQAEDTSLLENNEGDFTDFNQRTINWTATTGPSFVYDRSKWVGFRTDIDLSKAKSFDEESTEQSINISITKPITSFTKSAVDLSRICTEYTNPNLEDNCRKELSLSFLSEKKFNKFRMDVGISSQNDVTTDLYLLNIDHRINSYSSMLIESQKLIETISDFDQLSGIETLSFRAAVKKTDSILYVYEWGRKRFEFRIRKQETVGDEYEFFTQDGAMYYSYQLGSSLCRACKIGLSYEYINYDDQEEQSIKNIALIKNHTSKLSSSISFRRTQVEEVDAWSLNLLLSYKGSVTKLGKR